MPHTVSHLLAIALVVMAAPVHAEEPRWFVHVGAGYVQFHDHTTLFVGGAKFPGAGAKSSDSTTAIFEAGYRLTPDWSASATFGLPPTSKVMATGTAAALGKAGEVTYGPLVLAMQYRLGSFAGVRPYLGAGAVYYFVFKSKDGAVQRFDVESGWGAALQVGAEIALSQRWGLFLDVKKAFLKTTATGVAPALGGAAVRADATLDPVLVHAGVSFAF